MVNDIKAVNPLHDLSKFADDIAIMAPLYDCEDSIGDEVENMKIWSNENTRKVKVLSLPETIKEKSTFRAKALRRELVRRRAFA